MRMKRVYLVLICFISSFASGDRPNCQDYLIFPLGGPDLQKIFLSIEELAKAYPILAKEIYNPESLLKKQLPLSSEQQIIRNFYGFLDLLSPDQKEAFLKELSLRALHFKSAETLSKHLVDSTQLLAQTPVIHNSEYDYPGVQFTKYFLFISEEHQGEKSADFYDYFYYDLRETLPIKKFFGTFKRCRGTLLDDVVLCLNSEKTQKSNRYSLEKWSLSTATLLQSIDLGNVAYYLDKARVPLLFWSPALSESAQIISSFKERLNVDLSSSPPKIAYEIWNKKWIPVSTRRYSLPVPLSLKKITANIYLKIKTKLTKRYLSVSSIESSHGDWAYMRFVKSGPLSIKLIEFVYHRPTQKHFVPPNNIYRPKVLDSGALVYIEYQSASNSFRVISLKLDQKSQFYSDKKKLFEFPASDGNMGALSHDNRYLVQLDFSYDIARKFFNLSILDLKTGQLAHRTHLMSSMPINRVNKITLSPDSKTLVVFAFHIGPISEERRFSTYIFDVSEILSILRVPTQLP